MIKRMVVLAVMLFSGLNLTAGEVEDALESVDAPTGEFVRMPAKYIFQRLERAAQASGLPVLGGFAIERRIEGLNDRKISVSFTSMNMLEALHTTAKVTGTYLVFDNTTAVFGDESLASEPEDLPEEPVEEELVKEGEVVEFADVDSALVFVETGAGRASAFIAEQNGKTYIFSNQHNFMGASRLQLNSMHQGELEFKSFEFCRSRDLVRFELDPNIISNLGVLKMARANPYIGQEIVVYGNSAGGNVATELRGKVLGVGPRDIEVDADIVSGNSGSPIIDEKGRVLGVATYVAFELKFEKGDQRSEIFKGTRFRKTRRYGVRIPSDGWVKVNMRQFLEQSYMIGDWKNYLEMMGILVQYWGGLDDYQDFEDAANLIMDAYSTHSTRFERPYEFHMVNNETEVEMAVKTFRRNYLEFKQLVIAADLDKKKLAKYRNPEKSNSETKIQRLDEYIRTSMLSKAKKLQFNIKRYDWMSEYLEESAAELEKMADDLIIRLEGKKNLYPRVKAVM